MLVYPETKLSKEARDRIEKMKAWTAEYEAKQKSQSSQEKETLKQPIKDPKLARLEELEKKFIHNSDEYIEGLKAIREVKEAKLYLQVADTWDQYCKERLGRSVRAVFDQIKALKIAEYLALPAPVVLGSRDDSKGKSAHVPIATLEMNHLQNNVPVVITKEHFKRGRKQARKPAMKRAKVTEVEPMKLEIVPIAEDDSDLYVKIMDKINRGRGNRKFLKALMEWLDQSGI